MEQEGLIRGEASARETPHEPAPTPREPPGQRGAAPAPRKPPGQRGTAPTPTKRQGGSDSDEAAGRKEGRLRRRRSHKAKQGTNRWQRRRYRDDRPLSSDFTLLSPLPPSCTSAVPLPPLVSSSTAVSSSSEALRAAFWALAASPSRKRRREYAAEPAPQTRRPSSCCDERELLKNRTERPDWQTDLTTPAMLMVSGLVTFMRRKKAKLREKPSTPARVIASQKARLAMWV
mmetsp:Transcript_16241/g.28046  ORF Transcript_16241/g.28046 Transcript_16241/m.28046 type:complete len:231 (+) Transcript_16241:429-1121(+)